MFLCALVCATVRSASAVLAVVTKLCSRASWYGTPVDEAEQAARLWQVLNNARTQQLQFAIASQYKHRYRRLLKLVDELGCKVKAGVA
jgi:hypothetical protein